MPVGELTQTAATVMTMY